MRTDPAYGHIFDHFAIDYEYPNGVHVMSMCRQIDGCLNDVSEHVYGTDGVCHLDAGGRWSITGKNAWQFAGESNEPYQTEHDDLFASIRNGTPLNEGRMVAESTMTAILGRMATYSGKLVSWEEALNSEETWGPDEYAMGDLPVDPVPMPGRR